MALGFKNEGSGGDFLAIVKYDARAGRMHRIDRTAGADGWETTETEITKTFSAVFDLENIEVGWMRFASGMAPDFVLAPIGQDAGARPSDQHQQGFRVVIMLSKQTADGNAAIREFCSTAKTCLGALDALHDAYLTGVKAHPGMLPVVAMEEDALPVVTTFSGKKNTNYAPVFKISGWVKRPPDLVHTPRKAVAAAPPAPGRGNGQRPTPPAASSRAAPPPNRAVEEANDLAKDFG